MHGSIVSPASRRSPGHSRTTPRASSEWLRNPSWRASFAARRLAGRSLVPHRPQKFLRGIKYDPKKDAQADGDYREATLTRQIARLRPAALGEIERHPQLHGSRAGGTVFEHY